MPAVQGETPPIVLFQNASTRHAWAANFPHCDRGATAFASVSCIVRQLYRMSIESKGWLHEEDFSRFAKRPRVQFPHLQAALPRPRCNAGRSAPCANSAFGSKLARSLPLPLRRKERPRHRLKQQEGSCFGDQSSLLAAMATSNASERQPI